MLIIPIRDASVGDHDEFLLLRTNLCWKSLDAGGMFVAVAMVWLVQWICAHWDPGDASKNEDIPNCEPLVMAASEYVYEGNSDWSDFLQIQKVFANRNEVLNCFK